MDSEKLIEVVGPPGRIVIEKKDLKRHRVLGYVTAEEHKNMVNSNNDSKNNGLTDLGE